MQTHSNGTTRPRSGLGVSHVLLVALFIAAGSCSADGDLSGDSAAGASRDGGTADQAQEQDLDAVSGRFRLRINPAASAFMRQLRETHLTVHGPDFFSIIPEPQAAGFEREDGWILPRMRGELRLTGDRKPAEVRLPEFANEPFEVSNRGVRWLVRPLDLGRVEAASADDALVYAGALEGATLVHVPTLAGTEEYVRFDRKTGRKDLRYEVSARGAAGYRVVEGTIEVLTVEGIPVLRTQRPLIVDASGETREGSIELQGCAYDEDRAPPWGRPVTPPGAETCVVHTSWDDAGLTYPIMVDPGWVVTDNLNTPRYGHTATEFKRTSGTACRNGCVMVVGGTGSAGATGSAELFDETSRTWTSIASLPQPRTAHVAGAIGETVVVAGGSQNGTVVASSYYYNFATSAWVSKGNLAGPRYAPASVTLDGAVMYVSGGSDGLYTAYNTMDVTTSPSGAWQASRTLAHARFNHAMAGWKDTAANCSIQYRTCTILWVAGGNGGGYAGPNLTSVESTSFSLGISTIFQDIGALQDAVQYPMAMSTSTGAWFMGGLFAGGSSAQIHRIARSTPTYVQTVGQLNEGRAYAGAVPFGDSGRYIVAGGLTFGVDTADDAGRQSSEVLDETGVLATANMNYRRYDHGTVRLDNGSAMVTGGHYVSSHVTYFNPVDEIFTPQANGGTCTLGGECNSLYCADGVCCNSACTGLCQACSAGKTGGVNGTCGPITSGLDPENECPSDSTASCGRDGWCNGAGDCRVYASGTQCGTDTCGNGLESHPRCDGYGTCGGQVKSCGQYACGTGSCRTTCSSDDNCVVDAWCSGSSCVADLGLGSPCTRAGQCASGSCVDGYCCDSACANTCFACSAALKQSGGNGVCGPIKAATDPKNQCSPSAQSTCGLNGDCDGAGACDRWASGTSCGTNSCSGGTATSPQCNGLGTCTAVTSGCTPYVCGATACLTSCTGDAQCAPGYYCSLSACVAKRPNGLPCTAAGQCASGNCVDGFCCDTACAALCMACSNASKGAGPDGLCGPIKQGTDPANECGLQASSTCGTTGWCSGTGACELYAAGTSCGASSCSQGNAVAHACNGLGTCGSSTIPCAPYVCAGGACATTCASDGDCLSAYYCRTSDQSCQPDQVGGQTCTTGAQCASGNCVDGYCCDTACTGPCMACSSALKGAGINGVCGPIATGADPENECATTAASTCGTTGTCNGAGACALQPAGTTCATSSCSGGNQSTFTCNGLGSCGSATTPCGPYACSGATCGTSCTADIGCVVSYYCRTSDHSCQPDQAIGAACNTGSQCASGNCVDGVCCDTACAGVCQACTAAKKGTGSDGVCGSVIGGLDPDNECNDQGSASCATNGSCSGLGSCALYPQGTACGSTTCADDMQTGQACNGAGSCNPSSTTPCAPYKCDGSACGTSCNADTQCSAAYYCRLADHTCQPAQANGQQCTSNAQCASTNCVDGYCCDTVCQGACVACSAVKKGSGTNGACGPIAANTDPDTECDQTGATTCGTTGMCNGQGACAQYAMGTACGSTTCSNGLQTGKACDGFGTCKDAQTSSCAPYFCGGSACATTCAQDGDCIASHYCDMLDHTCRPDQANGGVCVSGAQCQTGNCVDGFCCDTGCQGTCLACSAAKKGQGADGICGPVGKNTDPDNECADNVASSCQQNGFCDGAGTCALYAVGTACGTTTCTNGVQTGQACNGSGSCIGAQTVPCAPFTCTGNSCATKCFADSDCVSGYFCRAGAQLCEPAQALGAVCTHGGQCASGNCVDGVCCDTACAGNCQACSELKKGSGIDGVCGNVADGMNSDNDCAQGPPAGCGFDGACNGQGGCRYYPQGASCGASVCIGNSVVKGKICNGIGSCIDESGGVDCAPYLCVGSACANPCATSFDCMHNYFCDQGTCKPVGSVGSPCSTADGCDTGFCIDGFCCDNACSGQCEACDIPGAEGECLAVTGQPHGSKAACGGQGDCASTCDGTNRTTCAFPGSAVVCQKNCVNNALTVSVCDGTGQCVAGPASSCGAYACASTTECETSCETKAECVAGAECVGQECVGAPALPGGDSGGTGGAAAPGADAGGEPPPVASDESEGGCGCRLAGPQGKEWGLWGFVLLTLCALRRRRRPSAARTAPSKHLGSEGSEVPAVAATTCALPVVSPPNRSVTTPATRHG